MPKRSLAFATCLAVAALFSLAVLPTSAQAFQCEPQVNETLQQQGVSQNDVDSVKVVRRSAGARASNNYWLDAWVRLKSCSDGALVVHMTRYCMVQDSYTTGDCEVGGMPSY